MTTLPANTNGILDRELTDKQRPRFGGSLSGVAVAWSGVYDGLGKIDPGTYETYRKMRANPTLAMARAAALGPIKAAGHSFEAKDGTPDGMVEFVQEVIDPLWHRLMGDVLRSVEYGWAGFEKVWREKGGRLVYDKIKPLLQDVTCIEADDHGNFTGLSQGDTTINRDKAALYTYDGECGNLYGRSRNENVREFAWSKWVRASEQLDKYMAKGAGIIPTIIYPPGTVHTQAGEEETYIVAQRVLNTLVGGRGIATPWEFPGWAESMMEKGIDPKQLLAWQISFLETRAGVGGEISDAMKYYDSLLLRGWLVPERSVIEGQHGTKAEAESHGDVAVMIAQDTLRDIVAEFINPQIIDPLLRYNFGKGAAGSVYAVPSPITNEEREFFRRVVETVMTNPGNIDILIETTDMDAMLASVGWPKASEVVQVTKPEPAPAPTTTPLAAMMKRLYGRTA